MVNFFAVYAAVKPLIGRDPTEIDYALFLDRVTHGGSPNKSEEVRETIKALRSYIEKLGRTSTPAELRWALTRMRAPLFWALPSSTWRTPSSLPIAFTSSALPR